MRGPTPRQGQIHPGKRSLLKSASSSRPSRLALFLGIPDARAHYSEQGVATLGALLGIALVAALTHAMLGQQAAIFVVPSLGATAVLIFAAPHSVFAQPWSVLGGNLLSALVGVLCQQLIPEALLAGAMAVALSIAVMHLARCIHPPGGAAALAAVVGGPEIHQLGFAYALYPVGLNCLLLIGTGLVFNYPFAWRRYPASLMRYVHVDTIPVHGEITPDERHIRQAMAGLNVVIDVSPAELREVVGQALALARAEQPANRPALIVGRCYGSRRSGRHWSVRQIVDERRRPAPEEDLILYRIVDGKGRQRRGECTRAEFMRWAGNELQPRAAAASRPPGI